MDFKRGLEATRSVLAEFMRDIVFSWIGRQMIPKMMLEGTRTVVR